MEAVPAGVGEGVGEGDGCGEAAPRGRGGGHQVKGGSVLCLVPKKATFSPKLDAL